MGTMPEQVERLVEAGPRAPGSEGERRVALLLRDELRRSGRTARLEPQWVRPSWPATHALHASFGLVGSVLAVVVPVAGVAVLALTLFSLLLDLSGRPWVVRRLTFERATQNVVSPPPHPDRPFRLLICAHYDAGRASAAYGERATRLGARLRTATRGWWPGPLAWVTLALMALLGCAIARSAEVGGTAVGAVQLAPTVFLILAVAALLDITLSDPSPAAGDNASGVAVALAVAAALDRRPPRSLAVEVVLAGAGEGPGSGLRAHLRARRADLPEERTVVLGLHGCGSGAPAWLTHEGVLLPVRSHSQLVALCERAAGEESQLGARGLRGHGLSPLAPARAARLPEVTVGCRDALGRPGLSHRPEDTPAHVDPAAMQAALAFCLTFVELLDEQLGAASGEKAG
jgi:hypothetical protein